MSKKLYSAFGAGFSAIPLGLASIMGGKGIGNALENMVTGTSSGTWGEHTVLAGAAYLVAGTAAMIVTGSKIIADSLSDDYSEQNNNESSFFDFYQSPAHVSNKTLRH